MARECPKWVLLHVEGEKGPEAGLDLLEALAPPAWLSSYYLWDATFGELYRRAGKFEQAERHLRRALERVPTEAERHVYQRRLDLCLARQQRRLPPR